MDPTALYYTFSTIAQALAGAFGVLAAFAVLALTRIEDAIGRGRDTMITLRNPGYEALWKRFSEIAFDEFVSRELSTFPATDPRLAVLARAKSALAAKEELRGWLIAAAALTAVDVAFSIIVIPFVPSLAPYVAGSAMATATAILLALICLVFYGKLAITVIGRLSS